MENCLPKETINVCQWEWPLIIADSNWYLTQLNFFAYVLIIYLVIIMNMQINLQDVHVPTCTTIFRKYYDADHNTETVDCLYSRLLIRSVVVNIYGLSIVRVRAFEVIKKWLKWLKKLYLINQAPG